MKPTLCLDFDGVIHGYQSGWKGATSIPDPPVPGAIKALLSYTEDFTVCIHSSRFNLVNYRPGTLEFTRYSPMDAVKDWLIANGVPANLIVMDADLVINNPAPGIIYLCTTKPPALITIDDRAITFDGWFPPSSSLIGFRPWNKNSI